MTNQKSLFTKSLMAAGIAACVGFGGAAFADSTASSSGVGAAITDSAITTKVKAKYLDNASLKGSDISVTTTNGVVTLTGSAPSSDAKSSAETIAKSVDGVKSVDDQLNSPSVADKVATTTDNAAKTTGRVASDSWITTKVKSKLLADSVTKGVDISVTTTKGVVALSGSLPSDAAKARAVKLTKQVKHVKSVDSSALTVAST